MKHHFTFLILLVSVAGLRAQYQFVSPMPGSVNLPPEHNIILRPGSLLDFSSVQHNLFSIQATKSGVHDFALILCDDGKTINLNPLIAFYHEDTVTVSIADGLDVADGSPISSYSFNFTINPNWIPSLPGGGVHIDTSIHGPGINEWYDGTEIPSDVRSTIGMFTITTNTNPYPGTIFFDCRATISAQGKYTSICAIDNNGDSVFQRMYKVNSYDFQLGKNGYFDTYRGDEQLFQVLDSNFMVIDSYKVANGFYGDPHELTMLANGYAFLTGEEDQTLSAFSNGNDSSGRTFVGSVIQELDPHHNIVFEWRSFDRIDTSEAEYLNPHSDVLDLVHSNSIDVDVDGNIIVSHRNLCQITKIDVNTGEFIWRLGGKKNEFTFTNDSDQFIYQHDCRRIANGNITLYDDGNYHHPAKSYAREYHLDEVNKTATLVWSYSHPDIDGRVAFFPAMGSVQRLPNGNTFINWGWRTNFGFPDFTEVDSDNNIVWELKLATYQMHISYRGHKYQWNPCARPSFQTLSEKLITDHSVRVYWGMVANPSQQYEVQYKKDDDTTWLTKKTSPANTFLNISGLEPSTKYDWRIQSWCDTAAATSSHFTAMRTFTTGEQNVSDDYTLSLYPNPATDMITIECSSSISHVRILNILGQKVKDIIVSPNDDQQFISVSVANLPFGNYFVEVSNDAKRDVRKVVVE